MNISSKQELSGRINAQVKVVGTSANVPLNVAGTIASPLLYPTGGTIAGAAVGTAILGPGLGTSVGAKVGGRAENLFGTKEEKRPNKQAKQTGAMEGYMCRNAIDGCRSLAEFLKHPEAPGGKLPIDGARTQPEGRQA